MKISYVGVALVFSVFSLIISVFALSLAYKLRDLVEQLKTSLSELGHDFYGD